MAKILLIDDEESIRDIIQYMLESMNHYVVVAPDGQKGVELFRSALTDQPFAIVITDLVMLNMDGRGVRDAIHELDSRTKVVICSGYSNDVAVQNPQEHGFSGALVKPFQRNFLEKLINGLLDD